MIGLFFEVQTRPGHRDQSLELAASLRPALDANGGCLFIDRFQRLSREHFLLSYPNWQDGGALPAWGGARENTGVQETGREAVFPDYRTRIAQVIHEPGPTKPIWTPERRTP